MLLTTLNYTGLLWVSSNSWYKMLFIFLAVLHPSHKLEYFRTAEWEDDWVKTAEEIVCAEFERTYMDVDSNASREVQSVCTPCYSFLLLSCVIFRIQTSFLITSLMHSRRSQCQETPQAPTSLLITSRRQRKLLAIPFYGGLRRELCTLVSLEWLVTISLSPVCKLSHFMFL
jgi:hypothetical protein